jgi:hypothetical protein
MSFLWWPASIVHDYCLVTLKETMYVRSRFQGRRQYAQSLTEQRIVALRAFDEIGETSATVLILRAVGEIVSSSSDREKKIRRIVHRAHVFPPQRSVCELDLLLRRLFDLSGSNY